MTKVTDDINKLVLNNTIPDTFILVCGGKVTSSLRKKITNYARSKSIKDAEVWTGPEFEEKLFKDCPGLLSRFVDGVPFPKDKEELIKFTASAMSIKGSIERNLNFQSYFNSIKHCDNYDDCVKNKPERFILTQQTVCILAAVFFSSVIAFYSNIFFNFGIAFFFLIPPIILLGVLIKIFSIGKHMRQMKIFCFETVILDIIEELKIITQYDSKGNPQQTTKTTKMIILQFPSGERRKYKLTLEKPLVSGDVGIAYISEFDNIVDFKYVTVNSDSNVVLV